MDKTASSLDINTRSLIQRNTVPFEPKNFLSAQTGIKANHAEHICPSALYCIQQGLHLFIIQCLSLLRISPAGVHLGTRIATDYPVLKGIRKDLFGEHEILDEETEVLRYTISDWKRHCVHLEYNYYSYKGSGFFFFPLPVGRQLVRHSKAQGSVQFSELDAIMDLWLHTILNDETVQGSEYMPVVYYANMKGKPLLSYSYLAKRWGWSKSRVGRFILKIEEAGLISRVSFSSSRGSIISPCRFREMIYGEDCEKLQIQKLGEILGIAKATGQLESDRNILVDVQTGVPSEKAVSPGARTLKIQVFQVPPSSFFARPVPLIFYSSLDWEESELEAGLYRGPPKHRKTKEGI